MAGRGIAAFFAAAPVTFLSRGHVGADVLGLVSQRKQGKH